MFATKVIQIIKDIQSCEDKEKMLYLSLSLPDELRKVKFLENEDLKRLMFDLEIKKYIYEEVKNHYTLFNEETKDALTTLILYLETLEIYKE